MNSNQNFAIEQLEARHETLWVYVPYWTICYVTIGWFKVPYWCIRWRWVWI